jgi:hypothetical protein
MATIPPGQNLAETHMATIDKRAASTGFTADGCKKGSRRGVHSRRRLRGANKRGARSTATQLELQDAGIA